MIRLWYKQIINALLIGVGCVFIHSASIYASASTEGIQVYQKNLNSSPERKQSLSNDIDRYHNADNLWDVLRSEFTLPHYEDNPEVQRQIQLLLKNQDDLLRTASRAAPYLYYILQQVRKRHLPAELVLIPIIESSYNPFTYSSAGASGIWQLMSDTASGLGVKQNWWYDGRRDVIASTNAALDYLSYLSNFFEGNWLLATAAYNTGEGNVLSAIKRNVRDGYNTDFWSLPLAADTRAYVPRLLALAVIISHPEQYPIDLPLVQNAPYLAQVDIGGQIDLQHAANLAGLSYKQLMQLNPGYNRSTTDPNGPFKLVLPIENVQQFTENLERSPIYHQINWVHYKTKLGDTLASVAKQFNTTPAKLREVNHLASNNLKPGKRIVIPRTTPAISQTIMEANQNNFITANNASSNSKEILSKNKISDTSAANVLEHVDGHYTLQSGDTLYMVRTGDDLEKIANHFKTTSKTLQLVNRLRMDQSLSTGQQLIIPTHISKEEKKHTLSPGDTIYMVRKHDSIPKIAKRFHTSPSAIRLANLLSGNHVQEGDRLIIPAKLTG